MRSKFPAMSLDERAQRLLGDRDPAGEVRAVTRDAVGQRGQNEDADLALEPLGGAAADADRDQRVGRERRVRPVRLGRAEREQEHRVGGHVRIREVGEVHARASPSNTALTQLDRALDSRLG